VISDEPLKGEAKGMVLDLLEIYYQNAEAVRNYDVSIEKSSFYEPTEKDSKEDSFLGAINHRIVMDWENERCLLVTHSYSEGTSSDERINEVRFADRFENGVVFSKHIGFEKRPKVENSTFHSFLKRVPMVEMMGLKMFPATWDRPFR
jgi:hypothetical protein